MIMAHKLNDHHGKTEHEKTESKFSDIGKDNDHHRHTEKERIESKFSDSDTDDDHHMHTECEGTTIFSDNFDSYAADQLNWVAPAPSGWMITKGAVDIIGKGGVFDFLAGNGSYVDLDGTSARSGQLSHTVSLEAGRTYSLSFDLAGSHRGTSEIVDVKFGTTMERFILASEDGFSHHTMNFTALSSGLYSFDYQNNQFGANLGNEEVKHIGALLDNVAVMLIGDCSPSTETDGMFS
jgi:hypothetical protein